MKELDQLVENFFQPKRDTLGLDQLVEMVEEVMDEQGLEEMAIDSFRDKDLQDILINFLGEYSTKPKEMIKTVTTGPTLHLTHFGNAIERDKAIQALKKHLEEQDVKYGEEIEYERNDQLAVGLHIGKSKVVLSDGRTHTKENIFYRELEQTLKDIQEALVADDNKNLIDIKFVTRDGETELFKNIDITKVEQIGGRGTKADFVIGEEPNVVYISHKDGGQTPEKFGQYGGVTDKDIYDTPEVTNFRDIIIKILFNEFGLTEYPSSIDFQQNIDDGDLIMKGVFGKKWEDGEESSDNNVDFMIQGSIKLIAEQDNEFPGKESKKQNRVYIIGGNTMLSKRVAEKMNGVEDSNLYDQGYFPEGYEPVLSTRRGDKKRANFGPELRSLRAAIQAAKGRKVNFVLDPDSTANNIQFIEHTLDKGQYQNSMDFLNSITPATPSAQDIWSKMFNSINKQKKPTRTPISLKKKEQEEENPLTNPPQ
jgi:hypothetical protein